MATALTAMPPQSPMFATSPTYQMACQQLREVAGIMDFPPDVIERLGFPKRSLIVNVPIRMDNGEIHCFIGYRVQHSLTSGPSKGGLRMLRKSISAKWRRLPCGCRGSAAS